MNLDRNARADQEDFRNVAAAPFQPGRTRWCPGTELEGVGNALSGRAGCIVGCTEVRNLVHEISVTQFQRARGHDRSRPLA